MSGFEVAGIALAVFPILVDGMVRFVDGFQTIKHWRRYRIRLQEYADIISTQGVFYQDTLEELLTGIVQSGDEITDLMDQPRGAIWARPEYEENLRQRLGRSTEAYLRTSGNMMKALSSMCEKLGVDSSGKLLPDDSSRVEREMRRIRVTLSKNIYNEALDVIDKANKDLREITHQNIYLETIRQKRTSKRPLAELKLIRAHAKSLYQVFVIGNAWKCTCRMLHMASLRLEPRPETLEEVNAENAPKVKFRVLLSTSQERENPWVNAQWEEIEVIPSLIKKVPGGMNVEPLHINRGMRFRPDPTVITTAASSQGLATYHDCESIADMCSTFCASDKSKKALGFLVEGEDDQHKHYLYRASTAIGAETRSKSLGDLLSCCSQGLPGTPLLRGDRLRIAVTLASSVLQLDGTSWLQSKWSSKDIFFHGRSNQASGSSYLYPYLSWKHCVRDINIPSSVDSLSLGSFAIRSEILLALGLTLIELCFGRTLAEMHVPEDGSSIEAATERTTAFRLCNSVYDEMGTSYGDAVRRCLYQPFDLRDMSLENEELQQKILDDIVTPLNNDLANFNGRLRIR